MIFNYLFYAAFFTSLLAVRAFCGTGKSPLRSGLILCFNLLCVGFFFPLSLPLLFGVAAFGYCAVQLGKGRPTVLLAAITALLVFFLREKNLGGEFPAGLSFVFFLLVGFLIDHRRNLSPRSGSFLSYAAAITFSPLLVAGPFVSLRDLVDQIDEGKKPDGNSDLEAALLFTFGLIKKGIADYIFVKFAVIRVINGDSPDLASVFALPAFLYADFSGYSDMARGMALAFGIRVAPNFLSPYLAGSFGEFWRRWHISLGDWFRVYVYGTFVYGLGPKFSLNRGAFLAYTRAAVLLTSVLLGLWHGFSPKYLFWGALIGTLACVPGIVGQSHTGSKLNRLFSAARLYAAVILLQLVFFSHDLNSAWVTLGALLTHLPTAGVAGKSLLLVAAALALNGADSLIYTRMERLLGSRWALPAVSLGIFLGLIFHMTGVSFVYSRF